MAINAFERQNVEKVSSFGRTPGGRPYKLLNNFHSDEKQYYLSPLNRSALASRQPDYIPKMKPAGMQMVKGDTESVNK